MNITHEHTDLFAEPHEGLAHGVNTHGVLGAGIAKAFAARHPSLVGAYTSYCKQYGNIAVGTALDWDAPDGTVVWNLFSQDEPGRAARYEWLKSSLTVALSNSVYPLHLPWIGAGIGGLDQVRVAVLMRECVAAVGGTLVVHTHPSERVNAAAVGALQGACSRRQQETRSGSTSWVGP